MNRNIIYIVIGITVAVMLAMLVGFYYRQGLIDKPKKGTVCTEQEASEETRREVEEAEKEIFIVPSASEYEKYFADAEYITVSKVVRNIEEREDGEIITTYEEYLVSDIDLVAGSDFSEDYKEAMKGSEFDGALVKKGSFAEIFGFEYEGKNAWEIYEELLSLNNVSGDLTVATFDESTYELTKQRLYGFEADEKLWEFLLNGLVYDEIINKQVTYQVMETNEGIMYPDCFLATVTYFKDECKVTRSMFLQVIVNR